MRWGGFRRRPRRRRRGIILVEVLVGILLAAVITSGVFMAVMSSRQALQKSDVRTQSAAASKMLLDMLGNYVRPAGAIPATYAPWGCWNFRNPHTPAGACQSGWALDDGEHEVDWLLPQEFRDKYKGKLKYTVATDGNGVKSINVEVKWEEL